MKILNKITKSIKSSQGSALVIVLLIIMLVSIFGFSLLKISANSLKQVDHERTDQAVFYIAEAGMNLTKIDVKNQLIEIEKSSSREIDLWIAKENAERKAMKKAALTKVEAEERYKEILNDEFGVFNDIKEYMVSSGKTASIKLSTELPKAEKLLYQISLTSTGYIGSAKKRVVKQNIKIEPKLKFFENNDTDGENNGDGDEHTSIGTPEGYAVFTNGHILFNDSGKIYGNVALSQGNITFKNWSAKIDGVVSIDKNTQKIIPYGNAPVPEIVDPLSINVTDFLQDTFFPNDKFELSHFNSIKTFNNTEISSSNKHLIYNNGDFDAKNDRNAANKYTIDLTEHSSMRFNNFSVNGKKTIYVDVGEKDTDLYINNLDIENGIIIIKGSGKLNLYINNFTNLNGSFNDTGDSTQVNFIYNGTKPFTLSGSTPFYGSLLNKSANISLGGSAAIYGNIISLGKSIAISGGSPVKGQSIIAPYANLKMSGSAKIFGTTVVDSITINGGDSEIHYATPVYPLPPGVGPENDHTDLPLPENNGFWIDESNLIEE